MVLQLKLVYSSLDKLAADITSISPFLTITLMTVLASVSHIYEINAVQDIFGLHATLIVSSDN